MGLTIQNKFYILLTNVSIKRYTIYLASPSEAHIKIREVSQINK